MVSETKRDDLLFEYQQLREEILQNNILVHQTLVGVLLIVGAIMGFATEVTEVSFAKALLFLIAACISSIGLVQTAHIRMSTHVIGAYLRIFIEPNVSVKWETNLHKLRNMRSTGPQTHPRMAWLQRLPLLDPPAKGEHLEFLQHHVAVYLFLVLVSALLGTYYFLTEAPNIASVLGRLLVLTIPWSFMALLYFQATKMLRNLDNTYEDKWAKIKSEEESNDLIIGS